MTTNKRKWAVVTRTAGKCDRYLSHDGMTWEVDPAKADLHTREAAERIAAEHGDGCEAERM